MTTIRSQQLKVAFVFAALLAIAATTVVVMTWPSLVASYSQELTGVRFPLQPIGYFDDGSLREGAAASLFTFSAADAQRITTHRTALASYPMWSALALNSYQRVRWQSLAELQQGPDRILVTALQREGDIADAKQVTDLVTAQAFAAHLSQQPGVLVAGWYSRRGDFMSNYHIYILDLNQRLLVTLSLLT